MRKSRFSEEQIIGVLREKQAGVSVTNVYTVHRISEQTYRCRKRKYGGMDEDEARQLKALKAENRQLKRVVVDLTPDDEVLKDVVAKHGKAHGGQGSRGPSSNNVRGERAAGLCGDGFPAVHVPL